MPLMESPKQAVSARRPSELSSLGTTSGRSSAGIAASGSSSSTNLYRTPTWARNINFDATFNLDHAHLPVRAGTSAEFASPIAVGVALGGNEHDQIDSRRASAVSAARNSSGVEHSPYGSASSRQNSGPLSGHPPPGTNHRQQVDRTSMLPSGMMASHQRGASSSSLNGNSGRSTGRPTDSSRPSMPSQPHSSADLYAQPTSASVTAALQQDSRPGTSLSMLSGSEDEIMDSPSAREQSLKRASILSFQTALSGTGGYTSNEDNSGDVDLAILDAGSSRKPWLQAEDNSGSRSRASSHSSSPNGRLPGEWRSRSWLHEGDVTATAELLRPGAATGFGAINAGLRPVSQSPRLRNATLGSPLAESSGRSAPPQPEKGDKFVSRESTPSASSPDLDASGASLSTTSALLSPLPSQALLRSPASGRSGDARTITPEAISIMSNEASLQRRGTTATIKPDTARFADATLAGSAPVTPSEGMGSIETSKQKHLPLSRPENDTSPPVPAKEQEVGLSSPPLSDDVAAASRLGEANVGVGMDQDVIPVADVRVQPSVKRMGQRDDLIATTGIASPRLDDAAPIPVSKDAPMEALSIGAGVGAHNTRTNKDEAGPAPAFAAMMRDSAVRSTSSTPRAALADPPPTENRTTSLDTEVSPREPSPPPEGEVEARAEWERSQMRRLAEQGKNKANATRKTTFRTQLKPLLLVAVEEAKQQTRQSISAHPSAASRRPWSEQAFSSRTAGQRYSGSSQSQQQQQARRASAMGPTPEDSVSSPPTSKSGEVFSTQQLQRMSARDSQLSASAVNMAAGVTEIGGAYPVFASPPATASKVSGRQYAGLMPQRSLVPPFELQNRPDGLPSGLIGPDGVRRSPNDPDVCLECMMRDEDMIDVHVLGAGLWERESDREFEEACRLDGEDQARREQQGVRSQGEASIQSHSGTVDSGNVGAEQAGRPRLTRIRVKHVAKHDPLTTERLKLHTQMNPPASSHRWRTLQTFLAVQAKYIALDQRARGIQASPVVPPKPQQPLQQPEYDNLMIRTASNDSKRATVPSHLVKIDERIPLTAQERVQKEKDIVHAREARRRNASALSLRPPGGIDGSIVEEEQKRLSAPLMNANENSSGNHSIPRRNNGPGVAPNYVRAGSAHDLRGLPHAMQMQKPGNEFPTAPASALVPPSAPFRSSTPQGFGVGGREMRTASSQLSLGNSGSMIDMHVGVEDRRDHRISQAGFLPGTPLQTNSPSAFNRAYYGFPGDSDAPSRMDDAFDSRTADASMQSNEIDVLHGKDLEKRRKKTSGLRGLLNKISGGRDTPSMERSSSGNDLSGNYGLSRQRKGSSGAGVALSDLQPPPGVGGLMSRARRSTSSLLNISGRGSMDGSTMLNDRLGLPVLHTPGMNSDASLDMGPFGFAPLPPPRKESRDPPRSPMAGGESSVSDRRSRTLSSGNLFGKRKSPNVSDLPISSPATPDEDGVFVGFGRDGTDGSRSRMERDTSSGSYNRESVRISSSGGGAYLTGVGSAHGPQRKSNMSDFMSRPNGNDSYASLGRPSPAALSVLQFDGHRQGGIQSPAQGQGHWSGQHAAYVGPTSHLVIDAPATQKALAPNTTGSSAPPLSGSSVASSGTAPPRRPPRNPSRGTPSQPASEHTQAETYEAGSSSYNRQPSPLPTVGRASKSPQITPMQHSSNGLYATPQQHQFQASYGSGMQAYPADDNTAGTANTTMHLRDGSTGPGMSAFDSDPTMDGAADAARDRFSSGSTPTASSRKSRLLKLPFGKNKRESLANSVGSSKLNGSNGPGTNGTPSLKSRSSRGTLDELNMTSMNAAGSTLSLSGPYARTPSGSTNAYGFSSMTPAEQSASQRAWNERRAGDVPMRGVQQDLPSMTGRSASPGPSNSLKPWLRNRRGSNTFEERSTDIAGLPPRSQSALGMLDSAQFDDADYEEPFSGKPSLSPALQQGKRGFLPRLRTSSRAGLRSVNEI